MEDSQLTRMAIEEIVRELGERKQQEDQRHERKLNPLGKPNKRFLGRTLSSVLTHNKRNNDRTQANCRRKLEELDDRLRRGVLNRMDVEERDKVEQTQHARKSSEFVHRVVSRSTSASALRSSSSESSSSEEEIRSRKRKKSKKCKKKGRGKEKGKKKRKIKKGKKRSEREAKNRSKSRTRSRSRSRSERASRARKSEKKSKLPEEEFDEYATADDLNYYEAVLDGHIGTTMFDNAMLHSVYTRQVQQLLCYQAMLADIQARTANAAALTDDVAEAIKTEFEDQGSEIMSSASSSLSMSSDLAEGEEVENGVLTINLSSDESASDSSAGSKRKKRKRRPRAPDSCSSSAAFDLRSNSSKLSHESVPEGGATTPCICLDSDSKDSAKNEGSNKSGVHGICLDSESEDSVGDSDHPRCMLSASNAALLPYSSSLEMDTIEAGLRIVQEPHTLIDLTDE